MKIHPILAIAGLICSGVLISDMVEPKTSLVSKDIPKVKVIYPEEWSEVKTGDTLLVIYADNERIEIGFNNVKNR